MAGRDALSWKVMTSGGEGRVIYDVRVSKNEIESIVYRGPLSRSQWTPKEAGRYRLKVLAVDEAATRASSDWSESYSFEPALTKRSRLAVLPLENLSANNAPVQEIHGRLAGELSRAGLDVLGHRDLEGFMRKHRIRDAGGLNDLHSQRFQEELGVDGVLISSLETWQEATPPRVSLILRLVTTGNTPEIVWMDSVGLTGDDNPGLLGLGRISSAGELLEMGLERLIASLLSDLSGNFPSYRHSTDQSGARLINGGTQTADGVLGRVKGRYHPTFSYRSPFFDPAREYRVAVVPFLNIDARKHAGEIIALHMVKQLHRYENLRVFEPGRVEDVLLHYRMIMPSGPSLAAADVLASSKILGADIILSGNVFEYQDASGESRVDFSIMAFDGARREIIWVSRSTGAGNDNVFFFDIGRIPSAHELASLLTKAAVQRLEE